MPDFSLARLEALLDMNRPGVVWRHDVDYDLDCAVTMAAVEREHRVQATYLIRIRANEYNAFSPEAREAIEAIVYCGHRVGLHLDLGLPREADVSDAWLAAAVASDLATLKAEHNVVDPVVTIHAPPRGCVWREIEGVEHLMSPEWEGRYCADSRGYFRCEPEHMIERQFDRPVQVNLHPEWWFLPEPSRTRLREREMAAP